MKKLTLSVLATLWLPTLFTVQSVIADDANIQILTIRDHKYYPEKLEVKAGERFKLKIVNEDATSEEFESKAMIIEKFISPKKSIVVNLGPLKPGNYDFFGCFHPDTAKGVLTAK